MIYESTKHTKNTNKTRNKLGDELALEFCVLVFIVYFVNG